jgi:hypothetical protein
MSWGKWTETAWELTVQWESIAVIAAAHDQCASKKYFRTWLSKATLRSRHGHQVFCYAIYNKSGMEKSLRKYDARQKGTVEIINQSNSLWCKC